MAAILDQEKASQEDIPPYASAKSSGSQTSGEQAEDVFGDERNHDIQYKTLTWQVSFFAVSHRDLMIEFYSHVGRT